MTSPRDLLARQQRDMLAQLLHGATHAGKVLTGKRRRELTLALPEVCEALGKRFARLFTRYAKEVGYPKRGGPAADALNFCNWLLQSKAKTLPDKIITLAAAIATQHRWCPTLARSRKSRHLAWRGKVIRIF
jgi:hypothetical protein